MTAKTMTALLIAALLIAALPAATHADTPPPDPADLPVDCLELLEDADAHHRVTAVLMELLDHAKTGTVKIYGSSASATMLMAWKVSRCGGRWLFAIFRQGNGGPEVVWKGKRFGFTTHFFPSAGLTYIMHQVTQYGLSLLGGLRAVINWPVLIPAIVLPLPLCDPLQPWIAPCLPTPPPTTGVTP